MLRCSSYFKVSMFYVIFHRLLLHYFIFIIIIIFILLYYGYVGYGQNSSNCLLNRNSFLLPLKKFGQVSNGSLGIYFKNTSRNY